MNQAYKLVWNTVSGSWVVASELAKGAKKSSGKTFTLAVLLSAAVSGGMAHAAIGNSTLPTGENVVLGSASMDRSVSNQLTVNQQGAYMQALWNTFSVGKDAKVIFNQPDANSVALNTVLGSSPSEIFGQVQANGKFYLTNYNGITFAAGSQVNAAAIVASTAGYIASSNDGSSIDLRMTQGASISNYGTLTATAGDVILLADHVINAGTISATGGDVTLMNVREAHLQNGVLSVTTPSIYSGVISNSGSITATQVSSAGGKILLTGDTSQSTSSISLAGTLTADNGITATSKTISIDSALASNGNTTLTAADNINIDADLTMGANQTLALTYGSDTGEGYFLDHAAKVNLSGTSAGFSVNGNSYSIIDDVTELQAMSSNLSGKYVLGSDIDASATAGWNAGAGFNPVSIFSGTLDGLGHEVSQLYINRPSQTTVGMFGKTSGATIKNIGLLNVNISGADDVGALIGDMTVNGGSSLLERVYASGQVTASGGYVGGLLGLAETYSGNSYITIRNSYSSVNVQANNRVGGLMGWLGSLNSGAVLLENSYASGSVSGSSYVGGLVGRVFTSLSSGLSMTLNNTYASGAVTGSSNVGGLLGDVNGAVITAQNSYWNTSTTGQLNGVGSISSGSPVISQVNGLTAAQAVQQSSYSNWGSAIDATGGTAAAWRIYDGYSAPLLRTFLKSVTATVADASKTYDGTTTINSSYTLSAPVSLLGSATYTTSSRNTGQQTIALGGLYSDQTGYDLSTVNGVATISKANLNISSSDVTKTYDGTTSAAGSAVAVGGTQVFAGDSLSGGTFSFDTKNTGSNKHVSVSGVTVNDGNNGGNYNVTYADNTDGMINKAELSITSTDVTKTYDGTRNATASAVVTGGTQLFGTDSLSGGTFEFDIKNAGVPNAIITSGVTVNDGNGGNNYNVNYLNNNNAVINKRVLTLTATAASKEYDGNVRVDLKPLISGRQRGDSISGLSQSFADKNAGTGKTIQVNSGFVINDENGGNNYTVVLVDSHGGVITPKALTISTVANSKVYDGGVTSANKPLVTGLVTGDTVTGLFQQYESKTVGTGKKLLIKAGYVLRDGNGGNNYTVTEQGSNDGVITAN